jgi:hypothetical protein
MFCHISLATYDYAGQTKHKSIYFKDFDVLIYCHVNKNVNILDILNKYKIKTSVDLENIKDKFSSRNIIINIVESLNSNTIQKY